MPSLNHKNNKNFLVIDLCKFIKYQIRTKK